jgi:uncharacterized protein (DUF2141 family)
MSFALSQKLNVTICNLKSSTKGTIRIAFFQDEKSFKVENQSFTVNYSKDLIVNGTLCVEIPVKPGVYGLSVLDDENDNGKMEYNLLGVPKEGFGFSNFTIKKMRKPKFKDFSFNVQEKEILDVKVKMKYF